MVRRVVAGHVDGASSFLADGSPAKSQIFRATPGMETHYLWATDGKPVISANDPPEGFVDDKSFLPGPGGTRFIYLQIAPGEVVDRPDYDQAAAIEEMIALQPEMSALMEPDAPGMHRTETIDYIVVLQGEIHLQLDNEAEVVLREHDAIIQLGGRHAWHNRTSKPVLLAIVLVGASRL